MSIFHRLTDNVDLENEPEFVEYSKIVPYFENLLKRYPPDFTVDKSGTLTKILDPQNISPWKLLTSNPNKTLLPFIHIPKAAGSSFRGALKIFKKKHKNENEEDNPYLSKDGLKYCNSVFPNDYTTASHSPGCKTGHPWGGTHCRYAEINDCLEQDQANLFTFSEDFFEDFYSLDGDMRKTILAEGEENELNKRMTEKAKTLDRPISTKNYDNIKFLSQIRHPVARTLSEFYYRRPQRSDVLGKRCSSNWSKGSCYIFDQRWANRNRTFANDNTENFQKVMKDEDLQILKEWIDDKSQDNISHNRQTRSLFPENEYRNKSLGFKLTGHCANMNGALDVKATQQNFGNENYTTRTFNLNYTLAVEAIENVEKNFAYVNVLEFRELSLGLLKIIFGIYKSDDQSSELIRSEIRSSQIYKKASLKTKDLDQILFDLKFASQRQNIKKFKKRKRRRRKRATHSSDGKPLGRPSKFKTSILLSLLEKNQLDFIIWEYFRRKFEASMRFYLKI